MLVLVQLAAAASWAVLLLRLGIQILPEMHLLQDFQQTNAFSFENSDPAEQGLT